MQPSGTAHVTLSGERWHQEECGHIRGRSERCLCPPGEASTTVALRNPRQGVRQRRVDDANRHANHAIAPLFCGEFGILILALLYLFGVQHACLRAGSEEISREQKDERRVGGSTTRRVRFSPTIQQGVKNKPCRSPKAVRDLLGHKTPQLGLPLKNRQDYQQEAVNVALDRLASPDDSSDVCRTVEMVAPVLCSAPGALAPDWGAGGRRSHH